MLAIASTLDVKVIIKHGAAAILSSYADRPLQVSAITVLLYAASIIALMPTTLVELMLGFVFGLRMGYLLDLAGKVLGCSLCYLLGLTVLKQCIRKLLWQGDVKELFLAFEEEVQLRPWRTAALLRVAFMPMSVKDYGMAIIGVPLPAYFGTLLPVAMFDTYVPVAVGSTAKDLTSLLNAKRSNHTSTKKQREAKFQLAMVCTQVAVLLGLLCYLGSVAKATIAKRRQQKAEAELEAEPLGAQKDENEPQETEPLGGQGPEAEPRDAEPQEAEPQEAEHREWPPAGGKDPRPGEHRGRHGRSASATDLMLSSSQPTIKDVLGSSSTRCCAARGHAQSL